MRRHQCWPPSAALFKFSLSKPQAVSESQGDDGEVWVGHPSLGRLSQGTALLARLHGLQAGGEKGREVVDVVVGPFVPRDEADQGHDQGAPGRSFGRKRARFGPYSRFPSARIPTCGGFRPAQSEPPHLGMGRHEKISHSHPVPTPRRPPVTSMLTSNKRGVQNGTPSGAAPVRVFPFA